MNQRRNVFKEIIQGHRFGGFRSGSTRPVRRAADEAEQSVSELRSLRLSNFLESFSLAQLPSAVQRSKTAAAVRDGTVAAVHCRKRAAVHKEPLEVWGENSIQYSIVSLVQSRIIRIPSFILLMKLELGLIVFPHYILLNRDTLEGNL